MLRRTPLAAVLALAVLGASACGGSDADEDAADPTTTSAVDELTGDPAALDAITVSGEPGAQPVVDVPTPFSVEESARQVLREGEGEALGDGETAIFDFVMVNGRDGSVYASSYGDPANPEVPANPAVFTMDDAVIPGVRLGMEGLRPGARVLVAIAPDDAFGPAGGDPQSGLEADDTVVMVADLLDVRSPLERAEGEPVPPVEGLPTVELDEDGAPTIAVPDTEPPADLVAQPLITGGGDVVEAGDAITVQYTGVLWDTGEVFDSSWPRGVPTTFEIGTGAVIPGWDEGLVGATVGSQVLLVVPPALGYPEGNASIPAGSTLVFVVDILDTHAAA
jgi:peptidylprolyl isomerase